MKKNIKCAHQFSEIEKRKEGGIMLDDKYFTIVGGKKVILIMCAFCGEQRKLWEDGKLEILAKE